MKHAFIMGGVLLGSVVASPAIATCPYGETGYLYVWATCVQGRVTNPRNICEVDKDSRQPRLIAFVTNVIADDGSNRRFPSSGFFDAIKIQHNVTLNGNESHCYRNRDEALDARDRAVADYRRRDYVVRRVDLRDH